MRNIELLAEIQQEHLTNLNIELLKPENNGASQYLKGRISELESQMRLLAILMDKELANA